MTEAGLDDLMREAEEAERRGDFPAANHLLGLALRAALRGDRPVLGILQKIFLVSAKIRPDEDVPNVH